MKLEKPEIIGYRRGVPIYGIRGGAATTHMQGQQQHDGQKHQGQGDHQGSGKRIPFHHASTFFSEKFFTDTVTTSTSQQQQTPHQITPGGFLRGVWLEFAASAGTLGTAVVGSDWPFSLIATVTLEDINGSPIVGPLSGYELYLINKYGNTSFFVSDPTVAFNFNRTFGSSTFFTLFIPVEARGDGLCSLANTDARAQYRVNYTIDSQANFLSTGTVTTPLTFTCTGTVEYWAQVEATNMYGQPQEQKPTLLDSTQFAYHEIQQISNSALTIKSNRVGNLIELLMYVTRTGAAATASEQPNPRAEQFTDVMRLRLDNRFLRSESPNIRRSNVSRQYNLNGAAVLAAAASQTVPIVEQGVMVYPFNGGDDRHPSPADVGAWLPTQEATFLQLEDTFANSPAGSTIGIVTQDVALKGHHVPEYAG